jgi:hypothetical protein
MKRFPRHFRVKMVLLVVSAFGAVLWTADAVWSMQEPGEVASMSKQMKTVCVGRFLIDLPVSAQVSIGSTAVDGFDIVNYGAETQEQFDQRMAQREAEINAGKNRSGLKNMESVDAIRHGAVYGKIFIFNRKTSYYFAYGEKIPTVSVSVYGYAHVNDMSFGFIASGYKPELAGGLSALLAQLQPMDKDTVPTQPGFCLDGAFLRDRASGEPDESIVMFAGLPGHEDLGIALATIAGTTPGPGLLERNAANRAGPYAFLNAFLSTLLEGKRSINGMEGDELAFRARERNFSTGYTFGWEMQGTKDNVLRPLVSLELQTGLSLRAGGQPVQSSLSEAAVSDLWRRMSSSLRVRPVVQPAQSGGLNLQRALDQDARASADERCRQSGSRQCGQADANARRGPLPALAPDAAAAPHRAAAGAVITVTPA